MAFNKISDNQNLKKMKLFLIILLCLTGSSLFSQSNPQTGTKKVIISGKIADSLATTITKTPYIEFYENYNRENPDDCKTIPLKIVDGQFKVRIDLNNEIGYFTIKGIGKRDIRSVTYYQLMVTQGDSLFMKIDGENKVQFSGRGAEKMNYQHWAGDLLVSDLFIMKSDDSNSLQELISINRKNTVWHLALALDSLNKISSITDLRIKDVLRTNTASGITKNYLNSITRPYYFQDTTYLSKLKNEVNFLITQQNGFVITDPFVIKNAFMYLQYIFELNKAVGMIKYKSDMAPINFVYQNIKKEYDGLLRDKLIPFCFLESASLDTGALRYLPEAITIIKDLDSKRILQQLIASKSTGSRAYEFSLIGVKGESINLDDFKGKIVILKTYENGCIPCVWLSENLHPVAEHFKFRTDVVFLNVNGVQVDDKSFIAGVKLGVYGTKKSIYARTRGLGQKDPFFLFYKFTAFPSMIIIGKNGKLISGNPGKPHDDDTRLAFIKLIENNL